MRLKKKILITGSTGFLGSLIVNNNADEIIFTLNRYKGQFMCDLASSIPNFNSDFDIVIHNAGKAHSIPKKEDEKRSFFLVNVQGTKNLLKGLETKIPKQFVFISSVSVYGLEYGLNIDEKTLLKAKDPYGLSKIQAEQLSLDWCKKHNVICTILRLPLLIGNNPPGNLGAMIEGIQKGYYFNISGCKVKKSMVLAEDIAKSILGVAEIGGIYNLTDGYHPSIEELSNHISIQLGKGEPMKMQLWLARALAKFGDYLGNKAPFNTIKLNKITSDLTFDDAKAREAFGWNPKPVLEGFKLNVNA
jgi:nucleoside-diphosphate-sugar epimerase